MTIGIERRDAISSTRSFLRELSDPSAIPRIPAEVRFRSRGLLRHYPTNFDLEEIARASPRLMGDPVEEGEA